MTEERNRVYLEAKTCAEAEFDELAPLLRQVSERIKNLRMVINAIGALTGSDVDDRFLWPSHPNSPERQARLARMGAKRGYPSSTGRPFGAAKRSLDGQTDPAPTPGGPDTPQIADRGAQ